LRELLGPGEEGKKMRKVCKTILTGGALLLFAGAAFGQAPPGPIAPATPQPPPAGTPPPAKPAQVTPRKNILGSWKLNKEESNEPHKRGQHGNGNGGNGGGHGGNGGGGPRVGVGWPGGGGGGYGGHRGSQGESDEERAKMQDVFRPPNKVTLTQRWEKDPEVDLTDDRDRKRAFFTDGRKLQKSKDASYEEIAAHWEDHKLVTEEKRPHGGKMSRTYELSPDGTQLWETVRMTSWNNPTTIRYVYDAVDGDGGTRAGS
jgi:hypothetical protein